MVLNALLTAYGNYLTYVQFQFHLSEAKFWSENVQLCELALCLLLY